MARYEGIEKFEEMTKNMTNLKVFLAGLNKLKNFMNEKEEFVNQINENIAQA
jgi:t-SNARE complex subunit (syntaxin)